MGIKIKYLTDVFKHHKPLETVRAGQPGTSFLIQLALCAVKLCVCRSLSLYQGLHTPRQPWAHSPETEETQQDLQTQTPWWKRDGERVAHSEYRDNEMQTFVFMNKTINCELGTDMQTSFL